MMNPDTAEKIRALVDNIFDIWTDKVRAREMFYDGLKDRIRRSPVGEPTCVSFDGAPSGTLRERYRARLEELLADPKQTMPGKVVPRDKFAGIDFEGDHTHIAIIPVKMESASFHKWQTDAD
jgi:hypothetical protein